MRTGRAVMVHEAPQTGGFGAEVVARITSRCFDYLERPVERVTGLDVPYPPPGLEHLYCQTKRRFWALSQPSTPRMTRRNTA